MTYEPVVAQPNSGGDLITRLSLENVNGVNYVTKRDWRRVMDAEQRREGHVTFAPNEEVEEPDNQPGGTEPIILVHCARKPNGKTAIIVATQTTLYRYFSFEDGGVYEDDVYEAGVYEDLSGEWLVIGDGFSEAGHRWEARDVAGLTVFNNGVDLPVIYDLGWLAVRPIYQLRDQGIAFAGTIEEFNGMLVLGDIAELTEDGLTETMRGRDTLLTVSQAGFTATAFGTEFVDSDVGKYIHFANGRSARILEVNSDTVVTVDTNQTFTGQAAFIAISYGPITDASTYSRVQYRLLVSDIGDATDFGSSISASTLAVGDTIVFTPHPTLDFQIGDEVAVLGAGPSGAVLFTTITFINGFHNAFYIADAVVTAAAEPTIQKVSSLSSVSSAFDLQDDGSAIIRISELQGKLVVLKETSIFVGQFTGTDPLFIFQRVYAGPNSIGWKWMLAKLNGDRLVYAGAGNFFAFDLSSLRPQIHNKLSLCQNLFFDSVTSLGLTDSCWSADNSITDEIWFVFPTSGGDKAICYDYLYDTCSTIAFVYTAGGNVEKPMVGNQIGVGEDWFVLGTPNGLVLKYGLTDLGGGLWTRGGSTYVSTLKSGLFSPPKNFDEQDLRNYIIYFSKYPTTPVAITLYGCRNAHEPTTQLFNRTITSPTYKNLIPTYFRRNYYQDQIIVSSASTNAAVVRRVLEFANVDTRSTIRDNTI